MKVHLLSVDSPRPITGTLPADCGKEVQKAWAQEIEQPAEGQKFQLNIRGLCKDCEQKYQNRPHSSREYLYQLIDGRFIRHINDLYI